MMGVPIVKLIGAAVLVLAIVAGVFFGCRALYSSGRSSGIAEKQIELDTFKADVAKAASDQAAKNAADEAVAAQHNRETHDAYDAQLAAARADAAQFAQRMYNALARLAAGGGPAAPVPGGQGPAPASGPQSDGGARQLSQLVSAARTECLANDDRLDTLVAEVTPQVP
jgi:hypothetical protein